MNDQEVRNAKRFNYIAFAVLCGCIVAVIGGLVWLNNRPVDPCLKTDALKQKGADLVLADGICYELEKPLRLADFCDFDKWVLLREAQTGDHILTVKLGDEYELAFYEGGIAEAFYGYAQKHYLSTAWYSVPDSDISAIAQYVKENGTIQQPLLGPGSWFIIHE